MPDLQSVWDNPNSSWLDKLGAIGNFLGTNANNAFQLAMILGGPEGDAETVVAEEEQALTDGLEACGGGLSFAPATLVATSRGEQTIGTMKVGEKVWAYNPTTHKMELEQVLHVWINHDNDLVDLTLTTTTVAQHGKGVTKTSETLHTNKRHPFLTKEKGFLPVGQMTIGMHVLQADGTYGVVTGWKIVPGTQVMYNLEVAQDHTYTVGIDRWVVHNTCTPDQVQEGVDAIQEKFDNRYGSNINWTFKGVKDGGLIRNPQDPFDPFTERYYFQFQDEDGYRLIISANFDPNTGGWDYGRFHFSSDDFQPDPQVWGRGGWKR